MFIKTIYFILFSKFMNVAYKVDDCTCCEMWRWLVKVVRRSFKLVKDLKTNFELASQNHAVSEKATDIKWSACLICQEGLKGKLVR